MERRLFIAGASGAVGRTVVAQGRARGLPLVPHYRPHADRKVEDPAAVVCLLSDEAALSAGLSGCTTVLQLIGTMRSRFSKGDTYESSDLATTRQLVEAAQKVGVDHFVLLSSVGAGHPIGAYLKAKSRAEALVTGSGLPFTVLRPSSFEGEGHRAPPGMAALTAALRLHALRPIRVEELASALLYVGMNRAHVGEVLWGRTLWAATDEARRMSAG